MTETHSQNSEEYAIPSYFTFASADGHSNIHACAWLPLGKPRAVVQIVHGMAEYKERYAPLAQALVASGFAVYAHDHIAHGHSVQDSHELGRMAQKEGAYALVADTYALREEITQQQGSELPVILLGHSMGSFVSRVCLSLHPDAYDGLVLVGTGNPPALKAFAGNISSKLISAIHGQDHTSDLLDKLGVGSFSKAIKHARTPDDWVNSDPDQVDAYRADPLCGFSFSAGSYVALTSLMYAMVSPKTFKAVRYGMPILLVAGGEDPVGEQGRGVSRVKDLYSNAGAKTQLIIYPGMRHEILNEPESDRVVEDILQWIKQLCESCETKERDA